MKDLTPSLVAFLLQSIFISSFALLAARVWTKQGTALRVAYHRAGIASILALMFLGPAFRLLVAPLCEISSAPKQQVQDPFVSVDQAKRHSLMAPKRLASPPLAQALPAIHATATSTTPAPVGTGDPETVAWEVLGATVLAGTALLLGVAAIGGGWVWRLRMSGRPRSFDCMALISPQSPPQVLLSPKVESAFVAGLFKPTIFLPENIEERFTQEQIQSILRHEGFHARQGDCLWNVLSRICCAVAWLNPLVWVLAWELSIASEELCDRLVIESGVDPGSYADCLLKIAASMTSVRAVSVVGPGLFTTQSQLTKRITLMLNDKRKPSTRLPMQSRIKVSLIAALAGIGACMLVSASPLVPSKHDATPEATVAGLFDAYNKTDYVGIFSRIEGSKVDLSGASKIPARKPFMPRIIRSIKVQTLSETSATVMIEIGGKEKGANRSKPVFGATTTRDIVTLHKINGDWKISSGSARGGLVENLIRISKDPAGMEKIRSASLRTDILVNLKQISLAVLMYSGDHNDKLDFRQATLKDKLRHYLKNDKVWTGTDGRALDIRFNESLTTKTTTNVEDPAGCVMFSLGPKDHLQYINGMTPIAFVDGHVKFLYPVEVARVKWK